MNRSTKTHSHPRFKAVWEYECIPASALLLGLVKNALRGKPGSPGISKLDTASVARDFWASIRLGHYMKRRSELIISWDI